MSKLERYLEFNWPCLSSRVEGSTEDKAIAVMREMDERLGGMSYDIERLVKQLRRTRVYVSMQRDVPGRRNTAREDLATIDALLAEVEK